MSVAVQAIVEGMSERTDLRLTVHRGHVVVLAGCRALYAFEVDDLGMRNIAVVGLTDLGFAGVRVAEVMGLTPVYVSMLRTRARAEGSADLVRLRGRPLKLSAAEVARARA